MRKFYQLVVLSLLAFVFQSQTATAQCSCPNGNNGNGAFISGALMTPTVACYEDLLDLINTPGNMHISAFDVVDGFIDVCIVTAPPANNCVGSIMIMVDAVDSDGNCASNGPLAVTVIIQDNIPPVISCPPSLAIECDESLDPLVNGNLGEATATDNCMADVTISYSDITISVVGCDTEIERTWTAEDCGGSVTCIQTITVQDTQAPTFTVPADIDVYVDVNCDFNIDITVTGDVTDEMDNCDPSVDATFVDDTNLGPCVGARTITRTWTAMDDCGNSNVQTQTITVLDEIPPVISGCPIDVTVQCDNIPSIGAEFVTYVDNCDPTIIGIAGNEQIIPDPNNPNPCVEDLLILRTWEATDDCGNTASCTQLVYIIDTTDPIITFCPADATVNCEDDNSSASLGFALATDNCSMNIDIQESDNVVLNGCDYRYVITRTWIATDECDNSTSCLQTITVEDNAPPIIDLCPPATVIECDQDTSALVIGLAEGDDLCSGMAGVYWTNMITAGSCTHTYTILRTFTLTDECGNSTSCDQTIEVEDTTPPDPTCPADETVECDAIPLAVNPSVSDLCDMSVDIVLSEVSDLTGCGNYTGIITRTWTFTDDCSNTAECVQVITVEDNIAPTWSQAMPANVVVNCQSVPVVPGPIAAVDGCDNAVIVTFVEDNQQGADPTQCDYYTYIITRTWTATDICGNETVHTQTINVQDVTKPNFTAPPGIVASAQLSCGDEDDLSLTGFPTLLTDNCVAAQASGQSGYNGQMSWVTSNGFTVSFTTALTVPQPFVECSLSGNGLHFRKYQVTRVWTVTDPCGNSTAKNQTINIIDNTPPVITCPGNVVVECSDDLSSAAQGVATATDNCDDEMDINITESDVTLNGVCIGEAIITRTWTAEDICGNTSSCTQTITTEDNTPPTLTCPANTVAECNDDLTPTGQGMATATDNCDMSPAISSSDAITAGLCDETYTITRTWTVVDECGNSTSCEQTIDVQDTTEPTFNQVLPGDETVNCQSVPAPPAPITGSDNCDAVVDIDFVEVSTQGVDPTQCTYYNYNVTRTWTATDNCGNEAIHTQVITVEDVTGPTFTAPADLVAADMLSCGDEEDLNVTGFPTNIMDNCAPDEADGSDGYMTGAMSWTTANGYQISFVDVEAQPFAECSLSGNGLHKRKYQIQRTWTIEDPCNNATTALQTMTIIDDTPPVITCPAAIVIECSDELDPSINLALGEATATDNCDDDIDITIGYADISGPGSCIGESVITRTWTATDVCGNSATCDQILTLEDTTPPAWDTAPSDDSVECGPAANAAFSAWLTSYAGAVASDNCSNVTLSSNGLTPAPGCGNTVVYSLNVRATDQCGLFVQETVTFTIEDTTPPVLTCAADIVVECTDPTDPANTGMSSATDNCGTTTVISSDATTQGACVAEYVIERTWTAEDECGLTTSCVQVITVDDSTPPVVVCPANTAVECNDDITSGANGVATATDNCDPAPLIAESDNILPGACDDAYTIERTWTATDECGNSESCIQEITVDDTTDPIITCAQDVVIECDDPTDPMNTGMSTATDNCDMDVTMTYADVSIPGGCPQEETITRTWTATDNCGNTATCDQTIEIEDTTPPVFTIPAMDEVIECDLATNGANLTAWLMSNAGAAADDNCGAVTLSTVGLTSTVICGNAITYSVTIRATDECGNSTDDPATFTINDTTAPDWDDPMPADATVECDAIPVADVFTANDLCDNDVDVTFSETTDPGACPQEQIITRTWTATDDCGNATTHIQTLTVDDSTPPTFTTPQIWTGNDGLECGDEDDLSITGFPTNIDDNCADDNVDGEDGYFVGAMTWMTATGYMISFTDAVIDPHPSGACSLTGNGLYYRKYRVNRTWSVTDPCGNTTTSVQEINITDHTPPVITCPVDVNVECSDDLTSATQGVASATDNCDDPMDILITESDMIIAGLCDGQYAIERTWTAEDVCGQTSSCVQTINVDDTTPPVFNTAPIDETIECNLATNGANFNAWLTTYGGAMASDACSAVIMSAIGPVIVDNCGETVVYTYTFRATDDCGNFVEEDASFTIIDTTVPTWDQAMPASTTVQCNAVPAVPPATASDLCDASVDVTFNETTTKGANPSQCDFYNYTLTRTWEATDDCSNAITHTQVITVEDTTAPSFTTPASILAASQLSCGDEDDLSLTGFPTAISDNCVAAEANGNSGYTMGDPLWVTANGYTISFTTVLTTPQPWAECSTSGNGLHNRKFHYTRTWTVSDPCGNSTTSNQTITVIDDTPPVWDQAMPADETVECDAIPLGPVGGVDLTASDNCDDPVDITYADDEVITPGMCTGEYTITRTWMAEDICGNAITHTQVITVEDTTPPTFTVPVDITIQADASCMYDADPVFTGDVTDEDDNCSGLINATYSDSNAPGSCPGEVILTRTWTLTDDCGLQLTQTQTITVQDMIDPILVGCPADVVISCLDPIPAAPAVTATDNCDPSPILSGPVEVSTQTMDGTCTDHTYTITRTWSSMDGCGNSTSCEQVISVEDVLIPVITLTGPASVDLCVGDSYTDMGATADDDCFGDITADIVVDNPVDVNTPGIYTITYNVSDPCGNAAIEVTRTVTVHNYPLLETSINSVVVTSNNDGLDDIAPPMEVCNATGNVFFDVFTDLNSVPGDVRVFQTRTLMNVSTAMCDNCAAPIAAFTGVSGTATLNDPTMDGTLVMRFRAWLDLNSNNTIDPGECAGDWVEYTFILKADVIMSCANDTTVASCQDQATVDQAFADWLTTTIYTGGKNPMLSNDNTGAPNACGGFTTVTWTVTSDCEADVTCSATFTVTEDDVDPTFTVPADIQIFSDASCAYDADPSITGDVLDEMDNCPNVLDATYVDAPVAGSCEGEIIISRTWTVEDACGNTTVQTQTITISDDIEPTFTVPADITIFSDIDCLYDADPVITGDVTDEADNCTMSLDATYSDATAPGTCVGEEIITRTWTLVDDCGNTLEQDQTITVSDNIAPVLIGCPADVAIACNDPMPVPPVVTATDNCDPAPLVSGPVSVSTQTMNGSCTDNSYTVTLTWTAEDGCGNTATCEQVVTVEDLIIPVITLTGPASVDLCVGDNYTDMGATAEDDCFGDITADIVVDNPVDVNTPGIYTVTYNVSDPCGNAAIEVTRTVTVHNYPLLETSINGVVVTSNNDGIDDLAPPTEICNATGNVQFDYFDDLNLVPGDVKAFQTRTLTNVSTSMCDNCAAPLSAFSPYSGTATLIDPTMDGTMVMRFRAWLDLNSNNVIDPGECAGDWVEYTFILKADVIMSCANDTTVASCQDQATIDQAFADWLTTTTFTGGKNPVLTDDNTGAPNACGGFTTVTWTVTSDCEADVTCSATFTVTEDDEDPVLTCPADLTTQCNISEQPVYADLAAFESDGGTATDNCDVDDITFILLSEISDNNTCPEIVTRTYQVADLCGNTGTCEQNVTVDDTIEPVLDATPGDMTVECDAVPVADVIGASDNCDLMVDVTYMETSSPGACPESYTLTRTWTAEDDCGNMDTHVQTITVIDTTMPDWDQAMPGDETVECDAVPVPPSPITATDNCDLTVSVSYFESNTPGNCPDNYTLTRTWTASDDCGNSLFHTQVITVEDTTPPALLAGCPVDETIECSDPVPAAAVVTAEDNCDPAPMVTMGEVTDLSGCGGYTGTITRTWTAEDACGNSADVCVQVITVEDTTMPTLLAGCPADATIECDDPVPGAAVVTAEDNCDLAPVVTLDEVTDLSGCGGYTGTITRTWTAEDACGNSDAICTQVITVQDTEIPAYNVASPAITIYTLADNATCPMPADIGLVIDQVNPVAFGQTPASFTVHGVTFDTPNGSATDNCTDANDLQLFVWNINDDFGGTADDCQRTIRVTYRLYDLCGNFRARSQDFTIIEDTPPSITCPADLAIQCDEDQSPANTGSATATDNCDIDPTIDYTEVVDLSGCGGYTGTITRTWTAEDNCSNISTCTQVITVEDTTPPALLAGCPVDETIECSDPVPAAPVVTAEDNCDPAPMVTMDEVTDLSGCGGYTGTITRTWTAEDACGNTADICVQVITVEDTTPPTFNAPADMTIQKDVDCLYDASIGITGDVLDEDDNCSTGLEATFVDDVTIGSCEGEEVITRTWTLEDDCGNITMHDQIITAIDVIQPYFPKPADVTITTEDGATCPTIADLGLTANQVTPISSGNAPFAFDVHGLSQDGPIVYTDNCSSPANLDIYIWDIDLDFNANADECERVIRVRYRVYDDCGNHQTRFQLFTILDDTPPTFTVPADVTIYTDNNCDYDPDPVFTGDVTDEADNCTLAGLDATYSDAVLPGNCTGEYEITRTWTLYDNCSNSTVQTQTIYVKDNVPPTFTVPVDIEIQKDVNCNYDADPVFTGDVNDEADNCSTGLDATYSDLVTDGSCEGEQIISRTWILEDDCGNTTTQIQTITAVDEIVPIFPKPDDITIYTDDGATCPGIADIDLVADQVTPIASGNAPFDFMVHGLIQSGPTVYSDNCSTAPNLDIYVWSVTPDFGGTADECMRSIRVIYRVYDDCDNYQQRQQIFTILDNTDPTFTVPADITIYTDANCNYDADPNFTGDVTDEDDNCSTGLNATYSDSDVPGNCTGEVIITRTWYLVDNCGNDSIQIQTITVQDNVPPTFTVPLDITIEKDVNCQYDADVSITGDVTDEADNCSTGLDAMFSDVVTVGACEGQQVITRTWTLTDDCGNETVQTQIITAIDVIEPIFPKPADQVITTEDGATCPGVADISLMINQAVPVASGNAPFVFTVHGIPFNGPTVYSDNCSTAPNLDLYVWNINTSFNGVGDECDRQIQVIFRVYDDCGNFQQRQQIFTIIENTPPDLSLCTVPLDGTVECTGDAGNEQSAINWDMANITYLYGCATDNCTDITVTSDYDFGNYIYACGLSGEITVVYTVTDECNNSSTTSATLTVEDNFGPELTNCPNLDYTIECDGAANNEINAAAFDANTIMVLNSCANDVCGDFTVTSDYNYANLVSTCGEAGVLTIEYTLEDECMNTSTFTAILTIEDTTPPTINFCPPAVAINCEDSQDPLDTGGPATASDICDANPVITFSDVIVPGACQDSYTIERTWTATDDCTNAVTCLQIITVIDVEKPIYNQGTPDVTIYTLEDGATCPGTPDISFDADQLNPIATGHVTVPFTVHGVTFQTPNGSGTDNCTPDDELKLYVWSINEDLFNDADECHRTIEVLFRLYDRCGNFRNRTQAYTIIENTPPVITCPADLTIDCDDDPLDLSLTLEATATDNCDSDPTITYSDVNDLNGCSMTGTITRTWMAEDNCINTSTCVQIITVQDVDPPVLIGCTPEDLNSTHECDGVVGNEAAAIAWNAANIVTLENCAYDVCGAIVVTSNYNFATLTDQCGETGSLVATYTVTDECLNTSTITGTFTVVDNTVPDLTGCDLSLLNSTHECDGDAGNLAAAQAWNAANVTFLQGCVTDLCGTITVTDTFDYANLTDGCGITGELVVTYTLTDECGNNTTATGTFIVEDTTDPSWDSAMPADVTVECDAVPVAFVATSSDGCDTLVDIVYVEVKTDGVCEDTYILTRTWTATDDCSNAITHTQEIQVQDTTVPTALCQDREIFLDENGIATITPQEVDNGSSDNCDLDVDLSLSKTVFNCDDEGPNPVVLTVTDNCSNSSTCDAIVTVTDNLAPIALCQDVTVSLDQFGQGSITPNDVDNGSYDNCGIASLVISQSQYNCTWLGTSIVTLTVTDIYNNVSTCTANVTVKDEIPPVALCKNYFVELNGQGQAPITYFDIDAGSTDNCSIVDYQVVPNVVTCADIPMKNVTLTVTDPGGNKKSCTATVVISDKLAPIMACKDVTRFLNAQGDPIIITPQDIDSGSKDNCSIASLFLNKTTFDCSHIGTNVVLLTAIDPSGNEGYCSATVTIIDAIPPVWTYMPGDVTVNCIDVFDDNPEAADNCGGVNINWTDVQEVWPAGPMNSYLVRRTWTAFDASGNEITYEQIVYVLPGGELLVNCNPDVITQPTHFPIKVDWPIPSVDDICEGSIDMVQIGGPPPLSYFNPDSETLITYEHIDIYGTHYQCSFWVIVPKDGSGYIVVLNEIECEDHSLTNCEVLDLPNPDNYSFEYILTNQTPIQFDVESNGNFEMFADGSAHLTGSWSNLLNTCGWDMDIWFHRRRTHDGWVDAGGNISSFSGLGDPEFWEFFEVDGSRSTMTGTGCYAGTNYNVRISPNFPKFGFQLGEGANTKTTAYGGWVILGMYNTSEQLLAQGIFSFELDCEQTNLIKDAAEVISLDGFNYPVLWTNGTSGPELGDVPPGMYGVAVTNQGGTTESSNFTLELPADCILYYEDACRPGNMTAGGVAQQISTYQGAVASRAIDQNTDGDFANGSVTSTLAGFQNSWSLAMANNVPIEQIRIWNRTDCCGDLLDPFYVFVSETPIPNNVFPEDLVFHPEILAFYHSGPVDDSFTFDVGEMGQYVKIQLAESGRLMLAEVQVLVCQEDKIGLKDDGFTAPEEEEVEKVQVVEDVPTVAYWPNPANDYLEIDITQKYASPIGVMIVNMQGIEVYRAKLPADHLQHLHLDTGNWAPGIYFMTISSANGARSLPLTIQH